MATITQRFVKRARARGVTVYTRQQWGARFETIYRKRCIIKRHHKFPSDTLVNHITVTHDTGLKRLDFFEDVRTVEQIGFDRFGSGMSYNLLIDMQTGECAVGQPLQAKGTHTVNDKHVPGFSFDQNYVALAIACVGMPGEQLSSKAMTAMSKVIASLMDIGALTRTADYVPHSLFAFKDCPTDAVRDNMPAIFREAQRLHYSQDEVRSKR